jgi:hypothetical protein
MVTDFALRKSPGCDTTKYDYVFLDRKVPQCMDGMVFVGWSIRFGAVVVGAVEVRIVVGVEGPFQYDGFGFWQL